MKLQAIRDNVKTQQFNREKTITPYTKNLNMIMGNPKHKEKSNSIWDM